MRSIYNFPGVFRLTHSLKNVLLPRSTLENNSCQGRESQNYQTCQIQVKVLKNTERNIRHFQFRSYFSPFSRNKYQKYPERITGSLIKGWNGTGSHNVKIQFEEDLGRWDSRTEILEHCKVQPAITVSHSNYPERELRGHN